MEQRMTLPLELLQPLNDLSNHPRHWTPVMLTWQEREQAVESWTEEGWQELD